MERSTECELARWPNVDRPWIEVDRRWPHQLEKPAAVSESVVQAQARSHPVKLRTPRREQRPMAEQLPRRDLAMTDFGATFLARLPRQLKFL